MLPFIDIVIYDYYLVVISFQTDRLSLGPEAIFPAWKLISYYLHVIIVVWLYQFREVELSEKWRFFKWLFSENIDEMP
jgi:hypothetical protein